METILKTGELELITSTSGAEIMSCTKDGIEYIWHGDPSYWGRRTPILFPFVGQVRNKEYRYDGKVYSMGQHGFARDMDFTVKELKEDSITYVLTQTEETLKVFPFRFTLEVSYRIARNEVLVGWTVRNTDDQDLYFSIGGHPAFMCPIDGMGSWDQYRIRFMKNQSPLSSLTIRPITTGGNVGSETTVIPLSDGCLIPSDDLFAGDALIAENMQTDRVSLIDPNNKEYLIVSFDTPLVGIWSPVGKHAPFICIEPWCGRTDSDDFEGSLEDREYGNRLHPEEVFHREYSIVFR
ncbi:MAG: aldose 1-epimerase family protein [Lachnospiraceae bacterium]|nr:aldose 1-epimerase family protein [Lachnospiraceae bacterium]